MEEFIFGLIGKIAFYCWSIPSCLSKLS